MTVAVEVPPEAATHPGRWTPVEPKMFGGPDNKSFSAPVELLHISVLHSGPGINEMVRFYQVALNLRHTFHADYGTWEFIALSHDDENHRIGIVNTFMGAPEDLANRPTMEVAEGIEERAAPQRPCRFEHINFRFSDFESLLLAAKRTHDELGIWPQSTRLSPVDFTIDYLDPDGNRVEMLATFTSTKAEMLFGMYFQFEKMRAHAAEFGPPVMDIDAFYMPISMEKLIGLYESGVPVSDLSSRPFAEKLKAEGKL